VLYAETHQLISEIASANQPPDAWRGKLKHVVNGFEQQARQLDPDWARQIRDDLCAQLEHEALAATRDDRRQVLLTALKNLEAMDWHRPAR
jgi:hypothetical protein